MAGAIDGAISGAIVGCLITPVVRYYAVKQQRAGKYMGKPAAAQVYWEGSYGEAFQRAQVVLGQLKARVLYTDPGAGVIGAGTQLTLFSIGSTVTVRVAANPLAPGVAVQVQSAPSVGLMDSGTSKRFVREFEKLWNSLPL